jgi:hypothetical protein
LILRSSAIVPLLEREPPPGGREIDRHADWLGMAVFRV